MWDHIFINRLEIYAYHGVHPEETKEGQYFYIYADVLADLAKAAKSDCLEDTVSYGDITRFIEAFLTEHTYKLLEMAAEETVKGLLLKFPAIHAIKLRIDKPEAPMKQVFKSVGIEVNRGWHQVYLGIGSNLGEKEQYVNGALEELRKLSSMRQIKCSTLLETEPYGGVVQDRFLNGVISLETVEEPESLLNTLHEIEQKAGRTREVHWGPRTLDLDILFYDDLIYDSETLCIPHPDMENRSFVLMPLAELAPYKHHPITHRTVSQMLQDLTDRQDNR